MQGGVLPSAPQVPTTGSELLLYPPLGTGRADPTGPGQDGGGQSRLTAERGLESQPGGAPNRAKRGRTDADTASLVELAGGRRLVGITAGSRTD